MWTASGVLRSNGREKRRNRRNASICWHGLRIDLSWTLERQWNDCLAKLVQAESEYARATKADGALEPSSEAMGRIAALASDFPRVWKDPRTSARERKRMLRLLVEDVTLARDEELIHVHIRWKGGATTSLEVPRPRFMLQTCSRSRGSDRRDTSLGDRTDG
jgi:hypothetical protein